MSPERSFPCSPRVIASNRLPTMYARAITLETPRDRVGFAIAETPRFIGSVNTRARYV
jgi:hypothetical protein